jgi:hypothetical protein
MENELLKQLKIKNGNGNKIMYCNYCKRSGHLRKMCYDLKYFCMNCKKSGHTNDRWYQKICENCYQKGHSKEICRKVKNPIKIEVKIDVILEWYRRKERK